MNGGMDFISLIHDYINDKHKKILQNYDVKCKAMESQISKAEH